MKDTYVFEGDATHYHETLQLEPEYYKDLNDHSLVFAFVEDRFDQYRYDRYAMGCRRWIQAVMDWLVERNGLKDSELEKYDKLVERVMNGKPHKGLPLYVSPGTGGYFLKDCD